MISSRHNRILVVRTDRIGDVVLSTPLIRALRKALPSSFIAAMVSPYARDVLIGNPHLNELLLDDVEGEHRGFAGFWNQVLILRKRRFDTALILLPKSRLTWMMFFAGIRSRVSIEIRLDHSLTFTRTVSRNKYIPLRHEADYCLDLGRSIGVADDGLDVEVFLTGEEKEKAIKVLESRGVKRGTRLVGIHPGSGRSAPNWKVDRYVDLASLLMRERNIQIVLTGSDKEKGYASAFSHLDRSQLIDATGTSRLRELMGIISQLDILVSASTGAMHIAAGLKVPTISLFCPLTACSPGLWGPSGNLSKIILPDEDFCQIRCPGDPHVCQFEGGIDPRNVAEAVHRLVQA